MPQLGVHFAITESQAAPLLAARGDDDALTTLIDALEEDPTIPTCQSDKAWEPISCALAPSGSERDEDDWPWGGVIMGAEGLEEDSDELCVGYTDAEGVQDVATELGEMDEELFAEAYAAMPVELRNAEYGEEERGYAWASILELKAFFGMASRAGLHVVFHVNM